MSTSTYSNETGVPGSTSIRYPGFHGREPRLIAVGLILLVIGSLAIYNTNVAHSYQSTFNILPTKFFKIASNLRDQTLITGNFQETAGHTLNFYIMSSVQFAAYQVGQGNTSLFSLRNVPTGSVSYTSILPDTYYLVFSHGTGLLNTTETVSFQRTYVSLDEFQVASGVILLGLGIAVLFWGLRPRNRLPEVVSHESKSVIK